MVGRGTVTERAIAWKRTTIEGLTIIVSILLALTAEATWQYRSDRADEREVLAGLRIEFEEAELEIRADLQSREGTVAAIRRLLAARDDRALAPPVDSLADTIGWLRNWRFYTPAHPVLTDVLASGRLDLIRSDSVRLALMSYAQERDRVAVMDELERTFVIDQLEPWLSTHVDLARVAPLSGTRTGSSMTGTARLTASEGARFLALLGEAAFGSLLQLGLENVEAAYEFGEYLLVTIERVQSALE